MKQAHREIYLLTDAERQTHTYSNRFAAHILLQHQLAALGRARGWSYQLQGNFDSANAPTLKLPRWGLRAVFKVCFDEHDFAQGLDNYVSEMGIFLYISTGQVRFHPLDDEYERTPLPLEEIPPLVFSEVMRDVDLFVGVGSIGNDPTWRDRRQVGHRFNNYWSDFSFGKLSVSAKTRKEVLASLLPRLTIGERCHLTGRFLVVRGDLRTYKIHLRSANILMEPNDQYLCIVPDGRAAAKKKTDALFLPFEGDRTLALILSKALLLANDTAIKDPKIVTQIKKR